MEKLINILEKTANIIMPLFKQLCILFLYFILILILSLAFKNGLTSNNNIILNLSYLAVESIILIVFVYVFRKNIVPDLDDFKKNGKNYIKKYFKYYIIGIIIMVISNAIIGLFRGLPETEEANRALLTTVPLYAIITMVLIAPITEELMTRVVLKDTFKHHFIYILLSGLIFGSLHVIGVADAKNLLEFLFIIPYGALGCAFATMYYKSNNIWTNIFYHSFHNLICILLIFIGV